MLVEVRFKIFITILFAVPTVVKRDKLWHFKDTSEDIQASSNFATKIDNIMRLLRQVSDCVICLRKCVGNWTFHWHAERIIAMRYFTLKIKQICSQVN